MLGGNVRLIGIVKDVFFRSSGLATFRYRKVGPCNGQRHVFSFALPDWPLSGITKWVRAMVKDMFFLSLFWIGHFPSQSGSVQWSKTCFFFRSSGLATFRYHKVGPCNGQRHVFSFALLDWPLSVAKWVRAMVKDMFFLSLFWIGPLSSITNWIRANLQMVKDIFINDGRGPFAYYRRTKKVIIMKLLFSSVLIWIFSSPPTSTHFSPSNISFIVFCLGNHA